MAWIEWTILWRRLDAPGHDACALWKLDGGWRLAGTAVFLHAHRPCHLAYAVECDAAWQTQAARVTGWIDRDAVEMTLVAAGGHWRLNGIDQPQVAGCVDADLGFTPATNLIALRRLGLRIGEEADAPAAWFDFPALQLMRLRQRYHRLDDHRYAYHAPDVGYAGTLEVSEAGFITLYPDLWMLEL
ncbi:MAG: putative glycolipid-binding domain-containing protein [Armatimonadota bacterium]